MAASSVPLAVPGKLSGRLWSSNSWVLLSPLLPGFLHWLSGRASGAFSCAHPAVRVRTFTRELDQ